LQGDSSPKGIAAEALSTAAIACFVGYRLTPKRFTPGFEHEISREAMAGVYVAMALGLAAGAWLSLKDASSAAPKRPASSTAKSAELILAFGIVVVTLIGGHSSLL
jgi:hypothetical protein